MSLELVAIGNELIALSEMFISASPIPVAASLSTIARAWQVNDSNVLLIVGNSASISAEVTFKLIPLMVYGTAYVLYEEGVTPRQLVQGVLQDNLAGYSIRIYSIHTSQTEQESALLQVTCAVLIFS